MFTNLKASVPSQEEKRVRLTSRFTLLSIVVTAFYLILDVWYEAYFYIILEITALIASGITLYLNRRGNHTAAKLILSLVSIANIFIAILSSGKEAGYQHLFFPVICGMLIIYPLSQWRLIVSQIILIGVMFFYLQLYAPETGTIQLGDPEITELINFLVAFFITSIFLIYLTRANYRAENILKSKEEETAALLNAIPDLLFRIDPDMKVINYRVDKKYNFISDAPGGTVYLKDFLPSDVAERIRRKAGKVLKSGKTAMLEHQIWTGKGPAGYFEVRIVPCGEKDILCILRDITRRKKQEVQLKKAKHLAEKAVKARTRFLSNLSHEIRTPLNSITGITNLLLEEEHSRKVKENLNIIKISSENLLILINDILDLSKIEAGKIEFERKAFDLRNFTGDHVKLIQEKASDKGIHIEKSFSGFIPETIMGDPSRLNQILLNLTSNAIKFTSKGGIHISVSGEAAGNDHGLITFTVKDTGIGIAREKLPDIFESFTQAHPEVSRRYEGTGLGLAIAKNLVELQGGTIQVVSEQNKGSEFSFTLKFKVSEGKALSSEVSPNSLMADLSDIRVLLVEDQLFNRLFAEQLLKRWNVRLDIAVNGTEALEKLSGNLYDLVLMDIHMPDMSGYHVTEKIRDKGSSVLDHSVPVIAVSADVFPEAKFQAFRSGMNAYISKPFNHNELFDLIVKFAGKRAGEAVGSRQ